MKIELTSLAYTAFLIPALPTSCAESSDRLPPYELSMRFTQPELYEGRDDFARENALAEMLRRQIVRPGMTAVEILRHLGNPSSHQQNPEEGGFIWYYEKLQSSGFRIYFEDGGISRKFIWSYDEGPYVDKPRIWE